MSSAADTSYDLTNGGYFGRYPEKKPSEESFNSLSTKYLDIDSKYRNRNNYRNPADFVIPITYPGRDSTAATAIDPVIDAIPYTGSTLAPGANTTQVSPDASNIVLDTNEIDVDNFYINSVLEISGEFRTITYYDGTTKTATVSVPFSSTPANGTVYYTRKIQPFYIGTVAASPAPTTVTFTLNSAASTINGIYVNSYVRFTSGVNFGLVFRIREYDGSTRVAVIAGTMPNIPGVGDTLELDSFSRDNASTLLYSGAGGSNVQNSYYEIEMMWISFPNQVLGTGYGGKLDNYPYIYVSLYDEGNRMTNQAMFSNNPNSPLALFKVPVNEYFGDTYFLTLKDCKMKQTIRFDPHSDLRFRITLPDGTTTQFAQNDTLSPNAPNPFLQINAMFSLKKMN